MENARQRGIVLVVTAAALATAILLALAALGLAAAAPAGRDAASDRALLQARESLVAWAAERALGPEVGPGYLPCPDLDDDGWAESTCGSLAGDVGQEQRLGRFPWKTLGLADLRDGHGERLWYAVSTRHKGLLNCAASPGCVDMTPDTALGTLSLVDPAGATIHDGRVSDAARAAGGGAAAVLLAPGAALARRDGWVQQRSCAPPDCDAAGRCVAHPPQRAPRCDPRNYLDLAELPGGRLEDNAAFHDRAAPSSRAGNGDGFVAGPPAGARGHMNDRAIALGYQELMPRVMRRVAAEAIHCMRLYAERPANGERLPWAANACASAATETPGHVFGRLPPAPFEASREASGGAMEVEWPAGCLAGESGWWPRWRPFVFYAVHPAATAAPALAPACGTAGCLRLEERGGRLVGSTARFAVIVSGAPLLLPSGRQDHLRLDDPLQWLEGAQATAAATCLGAAPERLTQGPRDSRFNDVVLAVP